MTKDQGLYNKPSAAVHPGALATGTLPQYSTVGVIYKFTLVRYSVKQSTTNRSMAHLVHLFTVLFLWLRDEHRRQWNWVDDFNGQCWLCQLSSHSTFVAATLGLPSNLGVGRSWLFPASSIKFLTRRSLKSWGGYIWPYMKITASNC